MIYKNMKQRYVIVIVILILIIAIYVMTKDEVINSDGNDEKTTKKLEINNEDNLRVTYEVIDDKKVEIYLVNKETNEKELFETLSDVYTCHYHSSEYHNDNLYIIRRIEYDGNGDNEWTDELWRYNADKKAVKIYSCKGLDFRVSPDERYIAIENKNNLLILDSKGTILSDYSADKLKFTNVDELWIGLLKWSDDSSSFWGNMYETISSYSLYKIDINSWEIKKFDISSLDMYFEYSLNPNNEKLVYSDYPALIDIDGAKAFKDAKTKVTLYLYNLKNKNKNKKVISSSIAKPFSPDWVDNNTIEFDNPKGEDRIKHILEE